MKTPKKPKPRPQTVTEDFRDLALQVNTLARTLQKMWENMPEEVE